MSTFLTSTEWLKDTTKTDAPTKDNQKMGDIPKDIEKFGDGLIKAWEQYLKIIDLLIAMCGGTVLAIGALIKDYGALKNNPTIIPWILVVFALTLLFIALWRGASQHFYEHETVGSEHVAKRYFSYYKIDKPLTRAFRPQKNLRSFYRFVFPIVAYGTGVSLVITWILIIVTALNKSNSEQIAPEKKIDSIACQLTV
jgi:hypothetical protein